MLRVELYGRPRCCLCDDAKRLLERLATEIPFELTSINIDESEMLRLRYATVIPVIVVEGREVAQLRIDEAALRAALTEAPRG